MSVSEQLTGFFAFAERFGVSSSLAAAIVLSLLAMSLKLLLKALSNRPRELNDAQLRVLTSGVDYQKKDALLREMIGEPTGKRYLVVGFGELTRKILSFLVARGETDVRWFTLEDEPSVEGVSEVFFGDLTDETSVSGFFRVHATSNKPKVVFHLWEYFNGHLNNGKDFRACYEVNVCGTKQLLDEAKRSGISLFLFRSAAAVCVTNSDQQNSMLAETDPVSTTLSNYLLTKAEAERQVVVQHRAQGRGKERMLTAGIRPATIFGCEDDNPVGEALRTGKFSILNTKATHDYVYVDNVAVGFLLLERTLWEEKKGVFRSRKACAGGMSLNITNREVKSHLWLGDVFYALSRRSSPARPDLPPTPVTPVKAGPVALLRIGAFLNTMMSERIPSIPERLSTTDVFLRRKSYGFTSILAARLLGYRPIYTLAEGLQKAIDDFRQQQQRAQS